MPHHVAPMWKITLQEHNCADRSAGVSAQRGKRWVLSWAHAPMISDWKSLQTNGIWRWSSKKATSTGLTSNYHSPSPSTAIKSHRKTSKSFNANLARAKSARFSELPAFMALTWHFAHRWWVCMRRDAASHRIRRERTKQRRDGRMGWWKIRRRVRKKVLTILHIYLFTHNIFSSKNHITKTLRAAATIRPHPFASLQHSTDFHLKQAREICEKSPYQRRCHRSWWVWRSWSELDESKSAIGVFRVQQCRKTEADSAWDQRSTDEGEIHSWPGSDCGEILS